MNIETLKSLQPQFDEVVPIDRMYVRDKKELYAAAFTRTGEEICLRILTKNSENHQELELRERKMHKKRMQGVLTRRQEIMNQVFDETRSINYFIESFTVAGEVFQMKRSSYGSILAQGDAIQEYLHFYELINRGVSFANIQEQDMSTLSYGELYLEGSYKRIPKILKAATTMQLKMQRNEQKLLVKKKLFLSLGEQDTKVVCRDIMKNTFTAYILNVSYYDIWKEEEARFEMPEYQERFSKEQIAEMKSIYQKAMEENYPKGTLLPMVEYEVEDDMRLEIYSKEELDSQVQIHQGSASFIGFLMKPDEKQGPHGGQRHIATLGGVNEKKERFEAEILMAGRLNPEEIIEI